MSGEMLVLSVLLLLQQVLLTSCSFLDQDLAIPLLEVSRLWIQAVAEQTRRVGDAVFRLADMSNPWVYLLGPALAVLVYYAFQLFFAPLNRVRALGDVGYIAEGKMTAKDMVNIVRKSRQVGDVPPVYPNGWFSVMESQNLRRGEAKSVSCLGKNFAVFRGDDGRSHVIDAYCPHMGANLAAGGVVKGSCLECPFHGWLFRGDDGKCTHIPYCERRHIPDVAKVTAYSTMERNGFIFLWHHAEGLEPTWEPPEIEEITQGKWKYHGRTEHFVSAHIEEIPENGADVAHLFQVHGPMFTAGTDLRFTASKLWSFARHDWGGQWNQDPDPNLKHVGVLDLNHSIKLGNWHFSLLDMKVVARQIGPGIVNLTFECAFGKGAYLQALTPVEPLCQKMIHHVYFQAYVPRIIPKFFLLVEALMVERDLMIWNNKRYALKAVFVKSKEDALVARHRRWYSQFYSEHSPRIKFQADTMEW